MSSNKHITRQHNRVLYLSLISMTQTCIMQFFPLYLKHLNLAAFEVGLILACQTWLSVLLLPIWFSLAKCLRSTFWKRVILCIFLFLIINTYLCLTFMPLSNKLQDITHCHTNEIMLSRKGVANIAHSFQDNYIPNNQVPFILHEKSNHIMPNVSSEVSSTNTTNDMANLGFIQKNKTDSKVDPGSKNNDSELPLFTKNINKTNYNFSDTGDNITTFNLKPYNSTRRTHENNFNYASEDNLHGLLSSTEKIKKLFNFKKSNYSHVHQTDDLFSVLRNNVILDTSNIKKLSSDESTMSFNTVSTESSYNFEINKSNNLTYNFNNFPILNSSLVDQEIQSNKKRVHNPFNTNSDYKYNKFLDASNTDTPNFETIATDYTKSRVNHLSETNRTNDLYYHLHNRKQGHHTRSKLHNINVDVPKKISPHATKTGYIENNDSDFQPPDRLEETINRDLYENSNTNPGILRLHKIKPPTNNKNAQKANAQYNGEENNPTEGIQERDWQTLKTLLQRQRYTRNAERKKHHRLKRHHHYVYSKKFYHELKKRNVSYNQKINSFYQYSLTKNINEKALEERKTIRNHRSIRRLMFVEESEEQNDKSYDSETKKIRVALLDHDKISKELLNIVINNKIKNILSLTFGTILLIAVLAEIFSKAIIAISTQFLIHEKIGGSFHQHITGYRKEDSQQIWTLITWGIFGCPTIALLVLFTECSYQPRVFIIFSIALIGMSLLLVFCILQIPETVWEWKLKDCGEEIDQRNTPFFTRLGYGISTFVAAFAMACNSEFILWYMDTLHGFPYNYQLLYCGYIAIGAIFQAVVKTWLLRKQMSAPLRIQDVDTRGDGVRNIGLILLGLHFLAASILQPAWSLLFLGVLQGSSVAFFVSTRISGWWAAGYGLGCMVGGFVVNLYSADRLFWIMAGSMFVWSAMVTLSRGLLKCIGNNDRDRASYSQLLLLGEDSDKEEVMVAEDGGEEDDEEECCNNDDWLEMALKKDEQQEAQRRRIMSCPT